MLDILLKLNTILGGALGAQSPVDVRRSLTAWLTAHPATGIPPAAWPLLDRLWQIESRSRPFTCAVELPRLSCNKSWTDRVSLWRGDITQIKADAIVNAANSGMTGCYRPFHACVDNAIHTAAGPWLRRECERIMALRGRPEPTGTVTVTPGFNLRADHVFHTVGPIVDGVQPTAEDEALLGQCYSNCLESARQLGLSNIAFCSISTGVFGYPKDKAAAFALSTIRSFLSVMPISLHVILVAFTHEDEAAYRHSLEDPHL